MELCKEWGLSHGAFLEVKNWYKDQKHLPQNATDEYFAMIMHSCYSDIKKTKKTIDAYFRLKSSTPLLFSDRSMNLVQRAKEVAPAVILPKTTEDGYFVLLGWLADCNPANFYIEDIIKFICMVVDVILLENPGCPGIVFLHDLTGFSFKHLFRLSISTGRKYLDYTQEACPIRIKGIHIFNSGAAVPALLNIVKPFIHNEYASVINMYAKKDFEVMLKNSKVTLDMIPREFGGQGHSTQKMLDDTVRRIASYEKWFKFDETVRVTEKK